MPPLDLPAANAAVHAFVDETIYGLLEGLVTVDVAGARARFRVLVDTLDAHMALEDERVMPAYAAEAPTDGAGRADHIVGDHVIINRHLDAMRDMLDALGDAPTLRDVLVELPKVYRLLATLEHHTAREQTHVYPALARALPAAVAADLTRALVAVIPGPGPEGVVERPSGE